MTQLLGHAQELLTERVALCAGSLAEAEALASTADEAVHSMQEEVSSEGEKEPDLEPGEHRPAKRPRSAPGTSDPGGKVNHTTLCGSSLMYYLCSAKLPGLALLLPFPLRVE